jgi:hypothetical protein
LQLLFPPASKKNKKLLDHLISTTHALMARFPEAAAFMGGDQKTISRLRCCSARC